MLRSELIRAMFNSIEQKYASVEVFFEKELVLGSKEIELFKGKICWLELLVKFQVVV